MKFSKELPSLLAVLSISIGWKLVLHCSLKLTVYQILFRKTAQRLRFKFSISSVWQLKQFQIDVWSKWILPLRTKLVWWDLTQLEEYAIDLGKVLSHSSPRRWTGEKKVTAWSIKQLFLSDITTTFLNPEFKKNPARAFWVIAILEFLPYKPRALFKHYVLRALKTSGSCCRRQTYLCFSNQNDLRNPKMCSKQPIIGATEFSKNYFWHQKSSKKWGGITSNF